MSSFAILSYPLNPNRDAWLLKRCMNQNTVDTSKVVETWVLKTAWFLTHSCETHVLVAPLWREVTYSMSLTEDCITVYSTPEVILSTFHYPLPSSLLPTPFFPFPLNTHLSPPRSFPFPLVSTELISHLFHSPSLTMSFLKIILPFPLSLNPPPPTSPHETVMLFLAQFPPHPCAISHLSHHQTFHLPSTSHPTSTYPPPITSPPLHTITIEPYIFFLSLSLSLDLTPPNHLTT